MDKIRMFFKKSESVARAALCMSGSGSNAEKLLSRAADNGASFRISVIFTDAPQQSKAKELAEKYHVPCECLDIRGFYAEHGEDDIRLNSSRRRELRDMWSEELWQKISPYKCDFAIFAGFIPLTNLADKLPCLNVHPGDLTIEKNGRRIYAGLHCSPVERAILDGNDSLRSSVILVQNYRGDGKDDIDTGPILGISAPVKIDLYGCDIEELKRIKGSRSKGAAADDKLREIALKNIENLKKFGDHVVFPETVSCFASCRYGTDDAGNLFFKDDNDAWTVVKSVEFSEDAPPVPRREKLLSAKGIFSRAWRYGKFLYAKIVRDNGSPDYIARGWALGMFIGCVMPVFCQLIVSVPLSFVVRGSKIGAALGTFITTPPTAIFIYPIQIWLGNKLINGNLSSESSRALLEIFNSETLSFPEKWSAFAETGWSLVAAFFAGGLLWAAIMTPLTYFGVRYLVKRYRLIRKKVYSSLHKKVKSHE